MTYEWDLDADHGDPTRVQDDLPTLPFGTDVNILGQVLDSTSQVVGVAGPAGWDYWSFINRTYPGVPKANATAHRCLSGLVPLGSKILYFDTADALDNYLTDPLYAMDDAHPVRKSGAVCVYIGSV